MNRLIYRMLSTNFGARLQIQILMRRTGAVFGQKPPQSPSHSSADLLKTYAQFTADSAKSALDGNRNSDRLQQDLYQLALQLGNHLRRWLKPKDDRDCLKLITLLYRNIGIEIQESSPGEFTVHRCYFSAFYTPEICFLISAIDRGIFAGIYQRGRLTFTERITGGSDKCRARLL